MNRPAARAALLALFVCLIGAYFLLDLGRYLELDYLQSRQAALEHYRTGHPVELGAAYFAVYAAMTALSLPGAALLAFAAGAVFGVAWGTVIISFASSLGATLAFLSSRFLFRDWLARRFVGRLASMDREVRADGAAYLFALRLAPLLPFFVVNLLMGLTPIRTWTFYWVSQIAMLPATVIYVNAGTRLAEIESLPGLLSPSLVAALVLLGFFPLIARRLADAVKARRVYARWSRPRRFDRNLVVIGGGAAGLVSAGTAAAAGARVTLVESHRMGGECLNTGCVPSKALVGTARLIARMRRASDFGLRDASPEIDFDRVMQHVRNVVAKIAPHDSPERYAAMGVECLQGRAKLISPWEVEVTLPEGTRRLATRSVIIATGSRPVIPDIPGIRDIDPGKRLTTDTVWDLRALPRRLLVLGGGAAGCELAQCFARLGSQVTLVERAPRLLPGEDAEAASLIAERFVAEGIQVLAGCEPQRFAREDGEQVLHCAASGGMHGPSSPRRIVFDALLCAAGRRANTADLGLEALGIGFRDSGLLDINAFMQTRYPNILACGDVAGAWGLASAAGHSAWHAAANALLEGVYRLRPDFSAVPRVTFSDPQIAQAGLVEAEARAAGARFEVTRYDLAELDRAVTDGAAQGFVKVLTAAGSDRVIGATIVGENAGESIAEFASAMRNGTGLKRILATVHGYPTWSNGNAHAAGAWRRAHLPGPLLRGAAFWNAWRRR